MRNHSAATMAPARHSSAPITKASWKPSVSAVSVCDPSFEELIAALRASSPEFCKLWKRHEVAGTGVGRKLVEHPIAGPMVFEHAVFNPAKSPDQRLVLYTPLPEEDTPAKLARLLEA